MNLIFKFYLKLLPFLGLVKAIVLTFRIINNDSAFLEFFLIGSFFLDLLLFLFFLPYSKKNRTLVYFTVLLLFSLIIGLLKEEELGRRIITDFTNPFLFFFKIFAFSFYWNKNEQFRDYIKYYTRVVVYGCLLWLPFMYFFFRSAGKTRIAVFAPLETAFGYHSNNFIAMSFIIILTVLYGKRAQVFSFLTIFFLLILKRFSIKTFIYSIFLMLFLILLYSKFEKNPVVIRLVSTVEAMTSSNKDIDLNKTSAGRFEEVETILEEMDFNSFLLGKGNGYTIIFDGKEHSNSHFSPIGFLSKYGIVFTVSLYIFIFFCINKGIKRIKMKESRMAIVFCFSILIGSLFSYNLFVEPMFPIVLGYLSNFKK